MLVFLTFSISSNMNNKFHNFPCFSVIQVQIRSEIAPKLQSRIKRKENSFQQYSLSTNHVQQKLKIKHKRQAYAQVTLIQRMAAP